MRTGIKIALKNRSSPTLADEQNMGSKKLSCIILHDTIVSIAKDAERDLVRVTLSDHSHFHSHPCKRNN